MGPDRWQHLPVRARDGEFELDGVRVERLEPLFAFARSIWHQAFDVAGTLLVFEFQRVRYGDRLLYDGEPAFIEAMRDNLDTIRRGETDKGLNEPWASGYQALSLVGSVVTFELRHYASAAGGAPGSDVSWTCLDLVTGKPPHPLDLFDEASLVSAMKADSCFGATLTPHEKNTITRFRDLIVAFEVSQNPQQDCSRGADAFERVAVLGYDAAADVTAVRFGFTYEIGFSHFKTSYFGMHVTPSPSFRHALSRVADGHGFLIGDAASWSVD